MLANPDDPGEEEEAGKSIAAATQQEEEITDGIYQSFLYHPSST